jgi:hypothetical protein
MQRISGILLAAGMIALGTSTASAQASAAAGTASGAASAGPGHGAAPVPAPDMRTEKQKELAMQTERLFDMATELKAQVDRTNRNILSLKVVQKAEEIEALAKGMRAQARK